jgi:hypothetical protein
LVQEGCRRKIMRRCSFHKRMRLLAPILSMPTAAQAS